MIMMNLDRLFSGAAVIIDDHINEDDDLVRLIISEIETLGIPLVKYKSVPSSETINHFKNLSFIVLDWVFRPQEQESGDLIQGVKLSEQIKEHQHEEVIEFLHEIKKNCFCPVFIISNESTDDIERILIGAGLFDAQKPSQFLVKSKSDFRRENQETTDSVLFKSAEEWLRRVPSMYVLKEWEFEYQKSKNLLFSSFQKLSPYWPCILWENFGEDGSNNSQELGELVGRNIINRMESANLDNSIMEASHPNVEKSELRDVLEGEKFLQENVGASFQTGDVYKKESDESVIYYINIRPQCDLLRNSNPKLYCLPGKILIQKESNGKIDGISFSQGEFLEKNYHSIVPFIDKGKIIEFNFKEMEILTPEKLEEDGVIKIGRLLPPYITKIQQRFALYTQRLGLPKIPKQAYV